jgi:hypothetical protein
MPHAYYICDQCHTAIHSNHKARVVSSDQGYLFFHTNPDCYKEWQVERAKERIEAERKRIADLESFWD